MASECVCVWTAAADRDAMHRRVSEAPNGNGHNDDRGALLNGNGSGSIVGSVPVPRSSASAGTKTKGPANTGRFVLYYFGGLAAVFIVETIFLLITLAGLKATYVLTALDSLQRVYLTRCIGVLRRAIGSVCWSCYCFGS